MRTYAEDQPHRHGFGLLVTHGRQYHKTCAKNTKKRIRRWAKRVTRREDLVQSRDE